MVKVSIIVPCYNSEKYLEQCLQSLINQTLKDIEILIVDDGSIDSTPFIAEDYSKRWPNIRVIKQKKSGVSNARNSGIKASQGKFLIFVDSDDTIEKDSLDILYNCALENESQFVYGGFRTTDIYNNTIDEYKSIYLEDNNRSMVISYMQNKIGICIGNFIVSKGLISDKNILFHEGCKYGEDREFIIKCLASALNIKSISKNIYNYRQHSNSAIYKVDIAHFDFADSYIRLKEYLVKVLGQDSVLNAAINKALLGSLNYSFMMLSRNGIHYNLLRKHMKNKGYDSLINDLSGMEFTWLKHPLLYYTYFKLKSVVKKILSTDKSAERHNLF